MPGICNAAFRGDHKTLIAVCAALDNCCDMSIALMDSVSAEGKGKIEAAAGVKIQKRRVAKKIERAVTLVML